jgi:hypothetical protein
MPCSPVAARSRSPVSRATPACRGNSSTATPTSAPSSSSAPYRQPEQPAGPCSRPRVTGASLRADAENYKGQTHRLRQQVKTLERRLSETLGRQLADALPVDELRSSIDHHPLQTQLEEAEMRSFELEESLAGAREELDAVREINRELLSQHNRGIG